MVNSSAAKSKLTETDSVQAKFENNPSQNNQESIQEKTHGEGEFTSNLSGSELRHQQSEIASINNKMEEIIDATPSEDTALKNAHVVYPVAGGTAENALTSPFGERIHPITGAHKHHDGIDIAPVSGGNPPVVAALDGTVTRMGTLGGYGNCIEVTHPDGSMTRYGHLKEFNNELKDKFDSGQTVEVKAGEEMALMGSTGNSTGVHLHFETHRPGGGAIDPSVALSGAVSFNLAPKTSSETFAAISHADPSAYIKEGTSSGSHQLGAQMAQSALLAWATESGKIDAELAMRLKKEQEEGSTGPATDAALRVFQQYNGLNEQGERFDTNGKGLAVDGILGIRTLNALAQWVVKESSLQSGEVKELFASCIYSKEQGNLDEFMRLTNGVWGGKEGVSPFAGDQTEISLKSIGSEQEGILNSDINNGALLFDAEGKLLYERYENLSSGQRKKLEEVKDILASEDTEVSKKRLKEIKESEKQSGVFLKEIEKNGNSYYALIGFDADNTTESEKLLFDNQITKQSTKDFFTQAEEQLGKIENQYKARKPVTTHSSE
jgi:murein DD-endopeptidase MepM/ murein hydrolase activator NlpD